MVYGFSSLSFSSLVLTMCCQMSQQTQRCTESLLEIQVTMHSLTSFYFLSFFLLFFFKVIPCYTFLVREDAFIIYLLVVLHNVCDLSYPVGAKSLQWSPPPTLCDLIDFSPPGSSVHGILQAGILEWVAMPLSSPEQ